MVEIAVEGRGDVRRIREQLLDLYGVPTSTQGPLAASWRGERVQVHMEVRPEGDAAVVRYRSLLSEALWRRDMAAAAPRAPRAIGPQAPQVFRLSEGGVF